MIPAAHTLNAILACPVCFGQNDSPLAFAINDGILVMIGIIAVLWVAFGSFFVYLWRKSRANAMLEQEGGSNALPQEGTV